MATITSNKGRFAKKDRLSEVITEEERCALDLFYFLERHVKLDAPAAGTFSFVPSPPQRRYLTALLFHPRVITVQPRGAGLTTSTLAFLLWQVLYTANLSAGIVAPAAPLLNGACDAFRGMYLRLAAGIKPAPLTLVRDSFSFSNGSSLSVFLRGVPARVRLDVIFVSDLALLPPVEQEQCIDQVLTALSPGGGLIIGSNPKRGGDLFHRLWVDALSGGQFHPVRVTWQEVWSPNVYLSRRQAIGDEAARTELDCEFV